MRVEVVLTEADIAQEFVEAIEARDLPEKFFYWFPRSAVEWGKLAGDPDLYGGLHETWKRIGDDSTKRPQWRGAPVQRPSDSCGRCWRVSESGRTRARSASITSAMSGAMACI